MFWLLLKVALHMSLDSRFAPKVIGLVMVTERMAGGGRILLCVIENCLKRWRNALFPCYNVGSLRGDQVAAKRADGIPGLILRKWENYGKMVCGCEKSRF